MKCAYDLGYLRRFGMMLGMGKRCPLYKLKQLLIWLAPVASVLIVAWSVHPTEADVEQAYKAQSKAEAMTEARTWIAERMKRDSQVMKIFCAR